MQWGRPKSLSGLMLVGLALIAVPLLIAILTAVLQIRDLADRGQKIVIQGVAGARASQQLFSQMASLERTARLYQVLADPPLLELYRTQDQLLSATREQLRLHARCRSSPSSSAPSASAARCASSTEPSASSARAPSPIRPRWRAPTPSSASAASSSGCGSVCSSWRTSAIGSSGTYRMS